MRDTRLLIVVNGSDVVFQIFVWNIESSIYTCLDREFGLIANGTGLM